MFDEIIVGSGLMALSVVLGLPLNRKVLVIGGHASHGRFIYYDGTRTVPCARLGFGGLGSYWHGVIPTGGPAAGRPTPEFAKVMRRFYPNTDVSDRVGQPWLFVPWNPIRPRAEWVRLQAERGQDLTISHEVVSRFVEGRSGVTVHTAHTTYRSKRVWVCAGALHTPGLLDRSLDVPVARPYASDHVFCYLGQIDRHRTQTEPLRAQRTRDGVWFEGRYDDADRALYMLRPARFAFTRLDYGIERRSAFGTPTGNAVSKIMRAASLGLFAEALYNRSGLFPNSRVQSVYAYITVPDAHEFKSTGPDITKRAEVIGRYVEAVRTSTPWPEMRVSKRPDLVMPAAHLHHSVDLDALARAGVNGRTSRVQVVDASVLRAIGPDHHSFRLMVEAFRRAVTLPSPDTCTSDGGAMDGRLSGTMANSTPTPTDAWSAPELPLPSV